VDSDDDLYLQAGGSKDPTKASKNKKRKAAPDSEEKASRKKRSHTKHTEKLISLHQDKRTEIASQ
jgi:hypothetical protein